jgi:hypothetical protein
MKRLFNLLLISLTFFLLGCSERQSEKSTSFYVLVNGESEVLKKNSFKTTYSDFIKIDDAHSGDFVFQTKSEDKHQKIGIDYSATPGSKYQVRIFRKKSKSKAYLRVSTENEFVKYYSVGSQAKNKNREEIKGDFTIPYNSKSLELHFTLVWKSGDEAVSFDDFEILKSSKELPNYRGLEKIELEIDNLAYAYLDSIRIQAIKENVIIGGKDSWVNGKMKIDSNNYRIKLRLKGDWTDHLQGNKWSFRIKILDEKKWNNQSTFSIQAPKTRSFSNEWLVHQMMEKEQILTTNYQFQPVSLNGTSLGIYAIEEHFTDYYLECRNLEGFIFKFSDDVLWKTRKKSHLFNNEYYANKFFLISKTKTHTKKNKKLNPEEYKEAYQAIEDFKNLSAIDYVDKDQFAKFFALCELTGAYHSLVWHNVKLFYNSKSKKLEPISYDCYTDNGAMKYDPDTIFGIDVRSEVIYKDKAAGLFRVLLNDSTLYSKYLQYLNNYSKSKIVSKTILSYQSELKLQDSLFKIEQFRFTSIPLLEVFPEIVSRSLKLNYGPTKYTYRPSISFDSHVNDPLLQNDFIRYEIIDDSISIINYNPNSVTLSSLKVKKKVYSFSKTEIPSYKYFLKNPPIKQALKSNN